MGALAFKAIAGFVLGVLGGSAARAGDAWAAAAIFCVLGVVIGWDLGRARKGRG